MRAPTEQNRGGTITLSIYLLFLAAPVSASTSYPLSVPPNPEKHLPDNKFCGEKAVTLWECGLPKKTVVLCLQRQGKGLEHLGLRAANSQGKVQELARGGQPGVQMDYVIAANGDTSLRMTTPTANYMLIDLARARSELEVTLAGQRKTQHYICKYGNQTLALNYNLSLFRQFGLAK
ncbi:hypothetical protein [Acidithiobacillus sp. AMEEHan]|uniref:hypothetical protein n=1 Tax=Acidithiobacillus sp. AMEEHan TaxID=2994951 RepID=UPI0027E49C1F|nr:hypothetical protein [Acidithiobacillus sp. AMEEHan]